ncbi:MAG: ATP-binding cassette domain-containing protein [Bacteroidetes bacterium]|nr:ATP-binding cassette domain-containing protein [Bacteroidota bacterium]
MRSLLKVENLSVSFQQGNKLNTVVQNFSIDLKPGEICGIVGESGSGKSVSCMSLTHLIKNAITKADKILFSPDSDSEYNLLNTEEERLRAIRGNQISYVFQEPMTALHPLFTCGEQLMEGILIHQKISKVEARKKVIELFGEMSLPDPEIAFGSYPHELSGGQRQRVMIAMALSNNPNLIIADEPTTALDSILQNELTRKMVGSCKSRNAGLILISHDINLIREFTSNIMVMYKGRIMESGESVDVVTKPKSPYTKSLLLCQPTFSRKNHKLPTLPDLTENRDGELVEKLYTDSEFETVQIDYSSSILAVRNLTKTFIRGNTARKVVDDVSFEMFKGETLGLVGESGCGKSTVSKIIMKMLKQDSGEIIYPKNESNSTAGFARQVQMIFQDPYSSLNPVLKAGEMLEEVLAVHNLINTKSGRREKVNSLLHEVGLSDLDATKYPHQFSGGQRQRLSIARALAVDPEIIICDESVSALDISVQAQILNLFNTLKIKRGLTYLFISHDMNVVTYLCDRIMVMRNGKIIEQNKTGHLVHSPESSYTKTLMAAMND